MYSLLKEIIRLSFENQFASDCVCEYILGKFERANCVEFIFGKSFLNLKLMHLPSVFYSSSH